MEALRQYTENRGAEADQCCEERDDDPDQQTRDPAKLRVQSVKLDIELDVELAIQRVELPVKLTIDRVESTLELLLH